MSGRFVQTSKDSVFGGLILPESHVEGMIKNAVNAAGAYTSTRSDNKNTVNWQVSSGSADADSLTDLPQLRAQARDLERNNPLAMGAINNPMTNIIGPGLHAKSRVNYEYLGISYEDAEKIQRKIDFYFNAWASSKNADITRQQNFYEMQDLILRSVLVSGDIGVMRRFKRRKGWAFEIAVQTIEADRIQTPTGKIENETLRSGIESDFDGEALAAWIAKKHPGDDTIFAINGPDDFTRVPFYDAIGMRFFLHIFFKKRPGQTRGITYLAAIIEPLKQLGRYSEAEITAAVISACFSVFVTSDAPKGPNVGLPGTMPGMVTYGPGHQSMTPEGTGVTKLQSGAIVDLLPGEKIEIADPKRPNTAFDPFVQAIIRQIGMALEQPYETLIKHYTSSYTAAQMAMNDLWKFVRVKREFAIANFCNPIREWVITECVAKGLLDLPGFIEDPFARNAWLNCVWSGPTKGHINPSVEADAEMKWVGMGSKSLSDTAMEQFGNDWEEIADQRERELYRYIELPVLVNPNLVTQPIDPRKKAPEAPVPVPADKGSDNSDPTTSSPDKQNDPNASQDGNSNA